MMAINDKNSFLDAVGTMDDNGSWERGFVEARKVRQSSPRYLEGLSAAAQFVLRLQDGKYGKYSGMKFQEAMTTSDFPLYFGDILDRSVLANYKAAGVEWKKISQVGRVADFRNKAMFDFSGPDAYLEPIIQEKGEYPGSVIAESRQTYRLFKRGRSFDLSWESLINDDLDVFKRLPVWFAMAAVRTEERFHTGLYAAAGGPNASLFVAPNAGVVTNGNLGTGVLNVTNLGRAIASMHMMIDPNSSEPILNRPKYLVVPPSLELDAKQILNSVNLVWEVVTRDAAGAADAIRPFPTSNFLRNELEIIVNPYLPLIDTVTGMTAWYLFAAPSDTPVTEVGFMAGYEAPQIFIKAADQIPLGGGSGNPLDGDFHSDDIKYKVRHVLGGTQIRPATATVATIGCFASAGTTATITNWPDGTAI